MDDLSIRGDRANIRVKYGQWYPEQHGDSGPVLSNRAEEHSDARLRVPTFAHIHVWIETWIKRKKWASALHFDIVIILERNNQETTITATRSDLLRRFTVFIRPSI